MTLVQQKAQAKLQDYRLLLYRRAIRPEFFEVACSRTVHQDDYEFEVLLSHGAHMLSLLHAQQWVVEVVTPLPLHFPTRGLMATIPCAGERDHEIELGTMFRYLTTVQTEVVPPAVYRDTLRDMQETATGSERVVTCEWREDDCEDPSLSVVAYQRFVREVHIQTWHLDASCGLIVRSQAMFELGTGTAAGAEVSAARE